MIRGQVGTVVLSGTSLSAPQWAGFVALGAQINHGGLGLINAALYKIGADPARYAADFYDITTGIPPPPGGIRARASVRPTFRFSSRTSSLPSTATDSAAQSTTTVEVPAPPEDGGRAAALKPGSSTDSARVPDPRSPRQHDDAHRSTRRSANRGGSTLLWSAKRASSAARAPHAKQSVIVDYTVSQVGV